MTSCGVGFGTGRATCRICEKKIEKGQVCIIFGGKVGIYSLSCQVHSNPKECDKEMRLKGNLALLTKSQWEKTQKKEEIRWMQTN